MKYPENLKNIIDVTKAPYYADNTGEVDCTAILRRVIDDVTVREINGVRDTEKRLYSLGENDVYIGFESRIEKRKVRVIFPEFVPDARIIYFPEGTYLVSDTVTYTHNNLKNIFDSKPGFELTRGIHFLGESREKTVIKLKDNSAGFENGSRKPVISFVNADGCLENETFLSLILLKILPWIAETAIPVRWVFALSPTTQAGLRMFYLKAAAPIPVFSSLWGARACSEIYL